MDNKSLFVKNFANHYDEENLKDLFETFGKISSVRILKDYANKSKGCGFINFQNHSSVQNALALNGHAVEGTNLQLFVGLPKNQEKKLQIVKKSQKYGHYDHQNILSQMMHIPTTRMHSDNVLITTKPRTNNPNEVNLFVNNLDHRVNDNLLENFFAQKYKSVVKGKAKVMRNGSASKGFGFVLFGSCSEAYDAIETMNGRLLGSQCIEVSEKREKGNITTENYLERYKRMIKYDQHGNQTESSERPHTSNHNRTSHLSCGSFTVSTPVEQNVDRLPLQVNLFVNNLDLSITDHLLEDFFAQKYNSVVKGKAKVMRKGSVSKGFGFVLFSSCSEAYDAIETMNGRLLGSQCIEVSENMRKRNACAPDRPLVKISNKAVDNIVTKTIEMTSLKASYIKRNCITDRCIMHHVDWKIVEHPYSIEMKGPENVLQKAMDWIEHQHKSTHEVSYTIQKIGISKYFQSEVGEKFLKDTEEKFKCVIKIEDATLDDLPGIQNTNATIAKQFNCVSNRIKCGYKIGNIVHETSDVIVTTSSSSEFYTGGGSKISKQLLQIAGPNLANECKKITKKKNLVSGDVVSTNGYNLKCKKMYHIIMEKYVHGASWKRQLRNSMKTCLQMADSADFTSISFPCVGTGGFGYPIQTVLRLFKDLVENSLFKNLTTVRLVVFEQDYTGLQELNKIQCASDKNTEGLVNHDLNKTKLNSAKVYHDTIQLKLCLNPNRKFEVLRYIQDHVDEKTASLSISDEIISELSHQEEQQIMDLEEKYDVKIQKLVDIFPPQFLIEGISTNVHATNAKIQEMLDVDKISRKCMWKIKMENCEINSVSKEDNFKLENNYKLRKKSCSIKLNDKCYEIEFQSMTARRKNKDFKVYRTEIEAKENLPREWTDVEGNMFKVDVPSTTKEYNTVYFKYIRGGLSPSKIIKLERIQNKTLFHQFLAQKANIVKLLPGIRSTQELFHGTSASVSDSIISNGFDRSYAGKNATCFGHGVYFAKMASYSNKYAAPDSKNHKRMFIAEVITGEYALGNSSHKVIPNTPAGRPYDSLVNSIANPAIFAVFKDASAYPKYLLTYQ